MNRRRAKRRLYMNVREDVMYEWPRRYKGMKFTIYDRLQKHFDIKIMQAEIFAFYGRP